MPSVLSVRARSAIAAGIAVTIVIAIGIAGFAWFLRWSADNHVQSLAEDTAEVLADRVAVDGVAVVAEYDGDALVQVVDDAGRVAAAGRDAASLGLPGRSGPARLHDDRYYVVDRPVSNSDLHVRVAQEYADDSPTRRTALGLLAGVAPAMVILVAVLAWFATAGALRPVARIRGEVEKIGASDLHRRIEVPATRDEIADLAATMNRLLDRLEAGSEAQRRFIADASHELRSPLATLRQYADLALSHPDDVTTTELGQVVNASSKRLQSLVDDLLVLATMAESSTGRGAPVEVDLDDVVLNELPAFRRTDIDIEASGLRSTKVRGQERRLAMAVRNLLANAVRHARGQVRVATGTDSFGAWLVVVDDGPGVPPEYRERIFDRFVRLDEGRARDAGGSGLGLAIVAAVVGDAGGTVMVDDAPGGGARFTVRLPVWPG